MSSRIVNAALLENELVFTTSRSGGPGGQNVNKVNSKVSLRFDVASSAVLTPEEKEIILARLRTKLTVDGSIMLSSQEMRSQLDNKENVIAKFDAMMKKAFEKRKARKATKPSKTSVQNRIKSKKKNAEKKKWRQRPE